MELLVLLFHLHPLVTAPPIRVDSLPSLLRMPVATTTLYSIHTLSPSAIVTPPRPDVVSVDPSYPDQPQHPSDVRLPSKQDTANPIHGRIIYINPNLQYCTDINTIALSV